MFVIPFICLFISIVLLITIALLLAHNDSALYMLVLILCSCVSMSIITIINISTRQYNREIERGKCIQAYYDGYKAAATMRNDNKPQPTPNR